MSPCKNKSIGLQESTSYPRRKSTGVSAGAHSSRNQGQSLFDFGVEVPYQRFYMFVLSSSGYHYYLYPNSLCVSSLSPARGNITRQASWPGIVMGTPITISDSRCALLTISSRYDFELTRLIFLLTSSSFREGEGERNKILWFPLHTVTQRKTCQCTCIAVHCCWNSKYLWR